MSTHVTVEHRDWETANSFNGAREHLEAVILGHELGFVFQDAGLDPAEIVQQLGAVYRAHNYTLSNRDLMLAHGYKQALIPDGSGRPVDIKRITRTEGVHIDSRPRSSGLAVTALNMWLGREGETEAQLLETSQEFANSGAYRLPEDTDRLLSEGRVDSAVLEPFLYEAQLRAGTLAVFRTAGRHPAAHRFISTSLPRASYITHAFSATMFQDK